MKRVAIAGAAAVLLMATAPAVDAGGGISLKMTVRVDPTPEDETDQVCAPTKDTIRVKKKTPLDVCYEVSNTSGATLTRHDLTDSKFGVILDDFPYTLGSGASAFIIQSEDDPRKNATHNGRWVAANSTAIHQATDRVKIKIKKKKN